MSIEPEERKRFSDEMHKRLNTFMSKTKFLHIFVASNFILSESLLCYEKGAYMGAAVLCRGAIDAAMYYLASRNIATHHFKLIGSTDFDVNLINKSWRSIKKKVREKGILDDELDNEIEKAREGGHLAAHFAQRLDKKIIRELSGKPIEKWELDVIGEVRARDTINRALDVLQKLDKKTGNLMPKVEGILEKEIEKWSMDFGFGNGISTKEEAMEALRKKKEAGER